MIKKRKNVANSIIEQLLHIDDIILPRKPEKSDHFFQRINFFGELLVKFCGDHNIIMALKKFLLPFIYRKMLFYHQLKIFNEQEPDIQSPANLFINRGSKQALAFKEVLSLNQPQCGKPPINQARILFTENALQIKSCAIT